MNKQKVIKEFQKLPGVGKAVSEDLWNMGFRSTNELKNKQPEQLYDQLNQLTGTSVDRCMLYTFRCIVYYVSNKKHEPRLLKWWNWTDKEENKKKPT